jgi:hypothetical protein
MNKRIRELHNQARDFYLQDEYVNLSMKDLHRLVEEKFAELIVGECAGIYDKIDNGNLHMGTDNYLEALHKTFWS